MSFRLKTILGIALIEVVLLAILLVSGHRYLQLSNEAQLQQRATTVAALFAAAAKDAVLSTDLAALESLVAEMLGNPDVVYARIKGDGIVLAQGGDGAALGRPYRADGDLAAVDDGVFDVHGDIEEAGFGFGRVELGLTVLPIRQVLAQARWATTAIAVLEVLLVALFSWLLGLYLTRQLQRLKAASNAVAEHGPGYQIPVVGKDEVAAAVGAFNHMSSRLADAQREQQQALISQRQLALQLMANEARFYQLFQASHDAIVLHDLKGHIVDANPQALALFDYPKDAFHRLIVPELHPPEALASARGALEAVASGGAVRFETQFRRRDGSTFPAEVSARRFEAGDDVLVQGIIRDITERREAEEALRRARHQAEEANRAKSRFLAAMSHDIRTPLNVILNANELLLETALDEEQRAFGRAVGEAGTTLMALVNDVLEFSKIEAGQLSLNLSTFEPRALAGGVMGLFTGAAEAKGLQFVCRCGPALPAVRSDPDRLRQVLVNLVGNAVKFTEAGHIELQVTLAPGAGGTQLGFAVADTGIGIPAERCAKVFGEFTQLHDGPHRRGGTGLGLAICQRVVKGLGGEIGVESREGEGSRFWFRVPVEVVGGTTAGDAAPNPPAPPPTSAPTPGRRGHILLVEDSPANHQVASALLSRAGHRVTWARDGQQAVVAVDQHPYDVVLMDLSMPVMDGLEATRRIRALEGPRGQVPIVALTANAFSEDRERCRAAGMDDYLTKPLQRQALLATVERWLALPADNPPSNPIAVAVADDPPPSPVLDEAALARLGADVGDDLLADIVGDFVAEARQRLAAVVRLGAAADWQALEGEAHALKGGANTFGVLALGEKAAALEAACRRGDTVEARALATQVADLGGAALAALDAHLQKRAMSQTLQVDGP